MNYFVQRKSNSGTNWQTVCKTESLEYAKNIFDRQTKYCSVGQLRLLDNENKIIKEKKVSLFL